MLGANTNDHWFPSATIDKEEKKEAEGETDDSAADAPYDRSLVQVRMGKFGSMCAR